MTPFRWIAISALSAFAVLSTSAFAQQSFHFGEGQASVAPHHAPPPPRHRAKPKPHRPVHHVPPKHDMH